MLKGISPLLSSDLVHTLMDMGHGDEIVLANANFPAHSRAKKLLKADGINLTDLLEAILQYFPLDSNVSENAFVLAVPQGDAEPEIWSSFEKQVAAVSDKGLSRISKDDFFARAANAFAIVASGETRLRSNIIIRKGVVLP
jgi:L-fucose mutarotase